MELTATQFERLRHTAISEFKMAAGYGVEKPVGMALMLRSQIVFAAHNAPVPSGLDITEQCLLHPHELLDAATERENIPACLEVAKIFISQAFNPDKPIEPQVDEMIKRKLGASPCIGDGQIIHVIHPHREIAVTFKL